MFYSLPWAHLHTWNASPLRLPWNLICGLTQGSCKVSLHPPSFRGLSLSLKAGAQAQAQARYEILTLQMAVCRRQWSSEHLTVAPSSAIIFTIVADRHPRTRGVCWMASPWRVSGPNMRCRGTQGTRGQVHLARHQAQPGRSYPQMWDGYNLIWIFLLCHQFSREYKQSSAVLSYYRVLPPPRSARPAIWAPHRRR